MDVHALTEAVEVKDPPSSITISGAEGRGICVNGIWHLKDDQYNGKVSYGKEDGAWLDWASEAGGDFGFRLVEPQNISKWTIACQYQHRFSIVADTSEPPESGWTARSGYALGAIKVTPSDVAPSDAVPNTCTCANGVGATGDACTSADSEICASCNDGHHLADSITCVPNNCNCANGVGMADGVACPSHNSETCASCNDNYQLAGNVCVTCCANGVPAEGECKCASCNDGYQLAENVCVIPVADFLGKFFDTESEACNYCRTRDVPMMSPTCDKCMSVPKVVGDNTKHMMFCDSTPSNEPYVCHQRGCKCKDDDTCEVIAANVEDCPQQPEPGYWTDTDKTDTDKLVPKSTQHAPHKWLN